MLENNLPIGTKILCTLWIGDMFIPGKIYEIVGEFNEVIHEYGTFHLYSHPCFVVATPLLEVLC